MLADTDNLTFDTQGRIFVGDRSTGSVVGFDKNTLQRFWTGNFGSIITGTGDLAFSPDGILYGVGENGSGTSYLIRFDTPNHFSTPVGNEPQFVGFSKVWGLTFVGQTLYGLTSNVTTGTGSLITIDLVTGKGNLVRKLGFNATGSSLIGRNGGPIIPP